MDQDELTASHWDDVFSSNNPPSFSNLNNSYMPPVLNNEFNDLNLKDDDKEEQQEQDDEENEEGQEVNPPTHTNKYADYDPEQDQLNSLRKEERQEHKHSLMSELTQGLEGEFDLENSLSSPLKKKTNNPNDSLFNDRGSPIRINKTNNEHSLPTTGQLDPSASTITTPKRASQLKNGKFKAPRYRKYSSKVIAKHLNNDDTKVPPASTSPPPPSTTTTTATIPRDSSTETSPHIVTDGNESLGPLGNDIIGNDDDTNLSDSTSLKSGTRADQLVQEANAPLYDIPQVSEESRSKQLRKEDDHTKLIDLEGDKKPTSNNNDHELPRFDISVGDPMKVGDITTAHIVYSIRVRNKNKNQNAYAGSPFESVDEITVSRRYKDFRWIYHQLQNNHPGKIIPPPPAKQTYIGRFNENFIENRRLSLEKMLVKMNGNQSLCNDDDFVMFLTSDKFTSELKERERLSGLEASLQANDSLDNEGQSILLDDNSSSTLAVVGNAGATGSGFMSSLFSMSNKIIEPDNFFTNKKSYIEDMEFNLKNFYKSLEVIGNQRVEMSQVIEEVATTINELSSFEISKVTSELLAAFSDVHLKLKENLDRVNLQDQLTLGFTIEEYLRTIGSIKYVFDARLKIYQQYYNFKTDLTKKEVQLDKLERKYNKSVDKINQLSFEVDKLKQKTTIFEKKFNTISDTIKEELEGFETDKIDDFRNSVEIFIESSIEAQKEAIELWETFYERQNLSKA